MGELDNALFWAAINHIKVLVKDRDSRVLKLVNLNLGVLEERKVKFDSFSREILLTRKYCFQVTP